MKIFLLKLFVRSADDVIAWLDALEGRLRKLAEAAAAEAAGLRIAADEIEAGGRKAAALADRVKG